MNRAVELAHRDGILTAASLMVSGPAAADAIERAHRLPALRVGLHLVLVDGRPTLPPERIPDLVDSRGWLRKDMAKLGADIFLRSSVRAQVATEIEAQFEVFAATGLALDHVNAHHHFHLHPSVAAQLIAIGRRHGMRALRVPREPSTMLDKASARRKRRDDWITRPWLALLARRTRDAALMMPDRVIGIAWSGAMTEERVASVVRNLPDGITEVYAHPATSDAFEGATAGSRHRDELAALTSPAIASLVAAAHVRRGGFVDFAPA